MSQSLGKTSLTQSEQFLIHADFLPTANHDGVSNCPWNDALCKGIAEAFVSVVVGNFVKPDHPLRHSWLEYLPKTMVEYPWNLLYTSIVESLATKPVAQTRERKLFKAPNRMRTLVRSTLHKEEPILPDLSEEVYLAPEYTNEHERRLRELGVRKISRDEVIDRIQADLVRLQSKTKTTVATDPWHEAFAYMLRPLLADSGDLATKLQQQRLKMLAMIPLVGNDQWTDAPSVGGGDSDQVYFAFTGMTPIPETLPLRLLDQTASNNVNRKAFYMSLGVKECPKELVFTKIREMHQRIYAPHGIIVQLHYMFQQGYNPDHVKPWVRVPTISGDTVRASTHDVLFPSEGKFDMYQLVPKKFHKTFTFLSEGLFDTSLRTERVNNQTWKEWLARATGARYCPRLKGTNIFNGDTPLSSATEAVLKHSPTKFLSMLRAHWIEYKEDALLVNKALRKCLVPCKSGDSKPLQSTYLPTADVMRETLRLQMSEDTVPILRLGDNTLNEATYRSWKFLEEFGTKSKPDLEFYILALRARSTSTINPDPKELAEIYKCMAQLATVQDYDSLRYEHLYMPFQIVSTDKPKTIF
jgi:hypothetical protein